MRTIFIGGPFKAIVDPATGLISDEYRARFESMIGLFEAQGDTVLNAHRSEGWGTTMVPAEECTARDWRWMNECDLFVAMPGDPASPGTHIELGWASALKRPTIVVTMPGQIVADLVTGLGTITEARHLTWHGDTESLLVELEEMVGALLQTPERALDPAASAVS